MTSRFADISKILLFGIVIWTGGSLYTGLLMALGKGFILGVLK